MLTSNNWMLRVERSLLEVAVHSQLSAAVFVKLNSCHQLECAANALKAVHACERGPSRVLRPINMCSDAPYDSPQNMRIKAHWAWASIN